MDVHRPETGNGHGVIFVAGSGWSAPLGYSATGLKEAQVSDWVPALLQAGYTVFAVNHRATPRFHYPAPVDDIQRAIRFIRHNAKQFGIDPARLGAIGGSSGGHLVGLAAMLSAPGISDDPDPVNRQPATLQCIVLRAAPSDLKAMIGASGIGTAAVVAFLNRLPTPSGDDQKVLSRGVAHRARRSVVSTRAPPSRRRRRHGAVSAVRRHGGRASWSECSRQVDSRRRRRTRFGLRHGRQAPPPASGRPPRDCRLAGSIPEGPVGKRTRVSCRPGAFLNAVVSRSG